VTNSYLHSGYYQIKIQASPTLTTLCIAFAPHDSGRLSIATSQRNERFGAIHPVQDQPNDYQRRRFAKKQIPSAYSREQVPDEDIADFPEIKQYGCHVDSKGVHANHSEGEDPPSVAKDINDEIERRHHQAAYAPSDKNKGAGPQ
jgi:hypothetical protein